MKAFNKTHRVIHDLSKKFIQIQKPIRILDSIKWHQETEHEFFRHKGKRQPAVNKHYYQNHPIKFNVETKREEFYQLERLIKSQLGQFSGIGNILLRMCREYRAVLRLLEARGSKEFSQISADIYGSSTDVFYPAGPTLKDLGHILSHALDNMNIDQDGLIDQKVYSAEEAVECIHESLKKYFHADPDKFKVLVSDGIISDAAAGADKIKIRKGGRFSKRDIDVLTVHEGWVHLGTTLNGLQQPICSFLSKGPPSSTIYQEGLAIIMEIFTFTSHPSRIKRLTDRVMVCNLVESGATFLDIYQYHLEQGLSEKQSYLYTTRVFRGSAPTLGPFTKDLSYSKGFILIYNYIRLAIQQGCLNRIPLLFLGKTSLEDLKTYEHLIDDGFLVKPKYVPPPFNDIAALSCWMSYSLFLNKIDLEQMAKNYRSIL